MIYRHDLKLEFVLRSAPYGSHGHLVNTFCFTTDFPDLGSVDIDCSLRHCLEESIDSCLHGMAVFLANSSFEPYLAHDLLDAVFHDEVLEVVFCDIIRVRLVYDGCQLISEIPDSGYEELPFCDHYYCDFVPPVDDYPLD